MRKTIAIAVTIVALLVVGLLAWGFLQRRQRASAVGSLQTVRAEKGTLQTTAGATGTVRANQTAQLNWKTSGRVGQVNVKPGERVTAGQELAVLDLGTLSQKVILAQADLVTAQKNLDDLLSSKLQAAQAQQDVENAQKALDDLQHPKTSQAQALEAVVTAQKAADDALRQLEILTTPPSKAALDQTYANMLLAENKLKNTKDQIDRLERLMQKLPPFLRFRIRKPLKNLQLVLAQNQIAYDNQVDKYNKLLAPPPETDVAIARANLEQAQAQHDQAQREFERVKNGATPAELASAQATLADALRNYDRLKNGPAPDDVAAAQAQVDAAQATVSQAHISAPFDAIVTDVSVKTGDMVNAGVPAFRLDDLSHLLVDVPVSEVDINQVQPGQDVNLSFDSVVGQEYHGKVSEVSAAGQSKQGVVTFPVTVELTDADQQVKPGMTTAVTIITSRFNDVLVIPNQALRMLDGQRVVYILKDGQPTPVAITVGNASDTQSEVIGGDLQAGDEVILNPPDTLLSQGSASSGGFRIGGLRRMLAGRR